MTRASALRRARTALRVVALVTAVAGAAVALRARRTGENGARITGMLEIGAEFHGPGTNLPRWAACMFPHNANPGALRRARPCPAEPGPSVAYEPGQIAGCWRIEDGGMEGSRGTSSFPLRLRTDAARTGRGDGERRRVDNLAIPDSLRRHPAFVTMTWRFSPPDSVTLISTNGFTGTVLTFRARGDTMPGMARGFTDVVVMTADTVADRIHRVRAVRIPC